MSPQRRRRDRAPRRALRSLRGAKQLVEVRQLGRVVAPCAADRTVLVDEKRGPLADAAMSAELAFDAERPSRVAVPVGEEREAQVEGLRPGDMRPGRVARDAERPHACLLELPAPVTQELHFARSGRGPVEEVEDEQGAAVGEQRRQLAPFVRRGPDGRVRYSVAGPQHARTLLCCGGLGSSSDLGCAARSARSRRGKTFPPQPPPSSCDAVAASPLPSPSRRRSKSGETSRFPPAPSLQPRSRYELAAARAAAAT